MRRWTLPEGKTPVLIGLDETARADAIAAMGHRLAATGLHVRRRLADREAAHEIPAGYAAAAPSHTEMDGDTAVDILIDRAANALTDLPWRRYFVIGGRISLLGTAAAGGFGVVLTGLAMSHRPAPAHLEASRGTTAVPPAVQADPSPLPPVIFDTRELATDIPDVEIAGQIDAPPVLVIAPSVADPPRELAGQPIESPLPVTQLAALQDPPTLVVAAPQTPQGTARPAAGVASARAHIRPAATIFAAATPLRVRHEARPSARSAPAVPAPVLPAPVLSTQVLSAPVLSAPVLSAHMLFAHARPTLQRYANVASFERLAWLTQTAAPHKAHPKMVVMSPPPHMLVHQAIATTQPDAPAPVVTPAPAVQSRLPPVPPHWPAYYAYASPAVQPPTGGYADRPYYDPRFDPRYATPYGGYYPPPYGGYYGGP